MDRVRAEGRQADGDVLRALGTARVADALTAARDHRLARAHLERAAVVVDEHRAGENERDLVELGGLEGLGPSGRRHHASDRDRALQTGVRSVDGTEVLVDDLATGNGDAGRGGDEFRHEPRLVDTNYIREWMRTCDNPAKGA